MPTTTFESVGQGTWSFTNELPGMDEWQKIYRDSSPRN